MKPSTNPFETTNFTVVPEVAASPAAGANYIGAVPVNSRCTLALLTFQLVTDVNAANRVCEIQLHRGADVYVLGNSGYAHIASKTYKYISFNDVELAFGTVIDTFFFPIPDLPLFLEGDTIRIIVVNKQAGDQLSAIRLTWKVWPYEQ